MKQQIIFLWCLAFPAFAHATDRAKLELQCVSLGDGPQFECTARLMNAKGDPINGAKLTLNAHMPSMPMAHSVKPTIAAATNQPGKYRGQLELEMRGVWVIQVDMNAPTRDRFIRRLQVESCEKDKRCPVLVTSPKTIK